MKINADPGTEVWQFSIIKWLFKLYQMSVLIFKIFLLKLNNNIRINLTGI